MNDHFTLNFHYYEQPFEKLFYILAVEFLYTREWRDQQRCAKADSDPQNIWDPRKNSGSFVVAIVGTLTNEANISISYYLVHYRLSTDSKTSDL